ncbi:uncharacterized protein LOC101240785 [Hydra vulgaris]|uniref:uncharacterized protein LOC101240785 n=1 Tax=Hydra vulgaris TaxID=6087 RepID=UPI000640DCB0|nr:uncharacterized protein LOC101240785 [Hydra vulgaris]
MVRSITPEDDAKIFDKQCKKTIKKIDQQNKKFSNSMKKDGIVTDFNLETIWNIRRDVLLKGNNENFKNGYLYYSRYKSNAPKLSDTSKEIFPLSSTKKSNHIVASSAKANIGSQELQFSKPLKSIREKQNLK